MEPSGTSPPDGRIAWELRALAGLPDDAPSLNEQLQLIVQLIVADIPVVDYASVTVGRGGGPTTVATTADLALAVDKAQYRDGAGPCLDAVAGAVTEVRDMATTMQWPGFRDAAVEMGLGSSLSIPVSTASGSPAAALNLYSHTPEALMALALAVDVTYRESAAPDSVASLDAGSQDLVTGLAAALQVRNVIQRAVGVLMERDAVAAAGGYLTLRLGAADHEVSILDEAHTLLAACEGPPPPRPSAEEPSGS